MKILLIQAVDQKNKYDLQYQPLGLAYIASYLRKKRPGKDEFLITSDFAEAQKITNEFQPDIIGISSITQNFNYAVKIAGTLKKVSTALMVLGGHHISNLPRLLPEDFDIGCLGEGEETFLQLINLLESSPESIADSNFDSIKGIVYRKNGELVINEPGNKITNLDDIPFPARDLFDFEKLSSHFHLITSRGCPFSCIFCSSSFFWGKIRFHSAQYVVKEIAALVNDYGAHHIEILDDLFITKRSRLREIVNLIEERGLNKNISYSCSCRANIVDHEIVDLLKRMNVVTTTFGFESGSQKVLSYLKGKGIKVEDGERAAALLHEAGIEVGGYFIIGTPVETEDDLAETMQFIKKAKIDFGETYSLVPLPGTPLWNELKNKGLVNEMNQDWNNFTQHSFNDYPFAENISENLLNSYAEEFNLHWERRRFRRNLNRMLSVNNIQSWLSRYGMKGFVRELYQTGKKNMRNMLPKL